MLLVLRRDTENFVFRSMIFERPGMFLNFFSRIKSFWELGSKLWHNSAASLWRASPIQDTASGEWSYLAPSGGRGSCLGLRTGVSPHFSISSKREMLADHERGAAPPPSSPMPDSGAAHTLCRRVHTQTAPGDVIGRRRYTSCVDVAILPTQNDATENLNVTSEHISSRCLVLPQTRCRQ